jgi:uncharacterized protein (TIGR02246 family)
MDRYRDAWISNDPDQVRALFTEDAVYAVSPWKEPWAGREEIVRRWTSEAQQDVRLDYEVLAVEGDLAAIHWHVHARAAGDPVAIEYDGVLTARFAADGRCAEHREWFSRRPLED